MRVRPFAEIFRPAAEEALSGLEVARPIRSGFASHLEQRFATVLSQVIYLHFSAHRISTRVFSGSSAGCHASFVREVAGKGLASLLADFPLAVDALCLLAEQGRRCTEDFATHLAEDRDAIAALLGGSPAMDVDKLTVGLSDPHRGGRTVVRVTFTDGRQLYYKPRSLATDEAWAAGLAALNGRLPLALRAPAAVDCGDHGWAEAIPEQRAMSRREAEAFYWRCGAWLGVALLLDATDLHRDNIVISGEHPVPVDFEAVLHPLGRGEDRSLARTWLLPADDGEWDPHSYLGETKTQPGPQAVRWRGLGSDELDARWEKTQTLEATHLPLVDGALREPASAAREIGEGFDAVARAAAADRERIAAWRMELSATPRRQMIRATGEYAWILDGLARPKYLKSAESRAAAIAYWQSAQPLDAEVGRAERSQLTAWDIPIFAVPPAPPEELPWDALGACREELRRNFPVPAT